MAESVETLRERRAVRGHWDSYPSTKAARRTHYSLVTSRDATGALFHMRKAGRLIVRPVRTVNIGGSGVVTHVDEYLWTRLRFGMSE